MIKIQCDICGSEEKLYRTEIEGTTLNVCSSCAKYGKVIAPLEPEAKEKPELKRFIKVAEEQKKEIIHIIVSDFPKKIRRKREQMNLTQKEFAKRIAERESVVHKLETGELRPSLKLAIKLEKLLKIKLIEEYEEKHEVKQGTGPAELTLGDMLKLRRS